MKNKIVLWGSNAQNEKVLIALELQAATNKVQLYTFPEAIASEDFVNKMMQEWRNGAAVEFPEGFTQVERDLSAADSLLPDDLKADRADLISRAQTEWHFSVLSAKLNEAYKQELAEFREKVAALEQYNHGAWDSLRGFWDKVQDQVRERNLFREHADDLRDGINVLFDELKKMRSRVNDEFVGTSQKVYADMAGALEKIEEKIAAGGNKLNQVFEDLKQLQRRYRDAKMTNEHRNQIWERLDGAFKAAKEKRFGPNANEGSLVERHARRLQGLNEAIYRMEDSIRRDEEELEFQNKKIAATEGQLESQIRKAKIKMVEERIGSKRDKLQEMYTTRQEVEKAIANTKEKDAKRAEKDAERAKIEQVRQKVKAEIDASATKLDGSSEKQDSLFEAATTVLGEVFENAIDSMKAVASVVAEKAEEAMEGVGEKVEAVVEVITQKAEVVMDAAEEKVEEVVEVVTEKAEVAMDAAEEKVEEVVEVVSEKAEAAMDAAEEKVEEVVEVVTKKEKKPLKKKAAEEAAPEAEEQKEDA